MKIKFLLFFAIVLLAGIAANAQGNRRTVEERVKMVHEKMDSAFKLEAAKLTNVDSVYANYFRQTDKARQELMAASNGERPDMQVMRDKIQPFTDAKDKELKTLLTDEQFKKWKEEIEPSMMRRPGGGGGGPR